MGARQLALRSPEKWLPPRPELLPFHFVGNTFEPAPRRSQLEPGLIERGTFRLKRLRRAAVIEFIPWNGSSDPEREVPAVTRQTRDPLKLARYYQSLLDSGQFETRAALALYLGVSRARVTQVLNRLKNISSSSQGIESRNGD
jgi:hypothetical protein